MLEHNRALRSREREIERRSRDRRESGASSPDFFPPDRFALRRSRA